MRLHILIVCCAFITGTNSFAQEQPATDIVNLTKVTFLNPGISYEARIGKLQSLYGQAFLSTSAYFSYSSTFGTSAGIYFDPAFTLQYRYYYNAERRAAKGRRTERNNLNYLSPAIETVFSKRPAQEGDIDENSRRAITQIGILWGMQRNYPKHFSLDLNLGIGFQTSRGTTIDLNGQRTSRNVSHITSMGQLNLGFWLN